jgi:hypothetical protein
LRGHGLTIAGLLQTHENLRRDCHTLVEMRPPIMRRHVMMRAISQDHARAGVPVGRRKRSACSCLNKCCTAARAQAGLIGPHAGATRPTSGISEEQSRMASGVQAARCSAVTRKPASAVAMPARHRTATRAERPIQFNAIRASYRQTGQRLTSRSASVLERDIDLDVRLRSGSHSDHLRLDGCPSATRLL